MSDISNASAAWTLLTAALLVAGSALTLIGSVGLLRLRTFYQRAHAPTLGTTLGMVFVAVASMIHGSVTGDRLILHELLIIVFVTATTPITLIILVSSARFRDKFEDGVRNRDTHT